MPRSVASFVLPLGATINMDGTALYLSCAAFGARSEGETLTPRPVDHRFELRPVTGGADRGALDGILQ